MTATIALSSVGAAFAATTYPSKAVQYGDGIYKVAVHINGKMMNVNDFDKHQGLLTVKNGRMNLLIRLNGTGFDKLYKVSDPNAGEEAGKAEAKANETNAIPAVSKFEKIDGVDTEFYNFNIPLENACGEILVSGHSKKKNAWYDLHCIMVIGTGEEPRFDRPYASSVKKIKPGKKRATVSMEPKQTVSGYELGYSTKKSMKSAKVMVLTGKSKASIKKLKSRKIYYFAVRTFNKGIGKTYYSKWSKTKKIKIN